MKSRKNITLTLVLGLLLSAFTVVTAQTSSQGDQKKETQTTTESCCCCSGDSCDMKMKDHANMKHDENMKHDSKGHKGDCCNAKHKARNKKSA